VLECIIHPPLRLQFNERLLNNPDLARSINDKRLNMISTPR
jgi:hypothetical protein